MSATPALGMLRQKNRNVEVGLGYTGHPRPVWVIERDLVSKANKEHKVGELWSTNVGREASLTLPS